MAEQNRATLLSSLTTYFPDNTSELISPAQMRAFLTNFLDSALTSLDDKPLLPFYNKGAFSGQLYYDSGAWKLLTGGSDAAINTSTIVTQDAQKIVVGADTFGTKWIFAGAWAEIENDAVAIRVDKQSGGVLHIYPLIGGPEIELANLEYDTGAWGLLAGGGSTMTLDSETDNQITLSHSDCGQNPPTITARFSTEVYTSSSISTTTTVVNLLDSSGGAFTPGNGDRLSISRASVVLGEGTRIDPDELNVSNARINFFGLFESEKKEIWQ